HANLVTSPLRSGNTGFANVCPFKTGILSLGFGNTGSGNIGAGNTGSSNWG
ncbi:hypothetical protein, partial [Mycobacterium tuberculosis]|uniref:hypothetical protein n=1 Tax=Mycobacterium tuberculosis TaxID=1773 RepID=UPI0034DFBB91